MEPSTLNNTLCAALEYLKGHPNSTAKEIAKAIGERDDRYVYKQLSNGAFGGYCQSWRGAGGPWRWQICPDGMRAVTPDATAEREDDLS